MYMDLTNKKQVQNQLSRFRIIILRFLQFCYICSIKLLFYYNHSINYMINRKKVLPIPLERITSKENHNVTLPTLSFPSSPNQMNDIVSALKNFTEKFTNIFQPSNEASNPRHTSKIEQRFQKVIIEPPQLPHGKSQEQKQKRKQNIQIWLGKLCREVFSVSFSLFESDKLNEKKMKAFCCENMLFNILKMINKNKLTSQQIAQMDRCLKQQLISYFENKYPLSQQSEMNLQFSNKIIQVDSLGSNQNDLVFKSNVKFVYNKEGNYNKPIMKLINYIIDLINKKQRRKECLFKIFYGDIENFFKNVEDQKFTIQMNNYDLKNQSLENNGSIDAPPLPKQISSEDKNQIEEQKKKQNYRQNVKSYTKKLIGRKISENTKPFSKIQLDEGDLNLKNPAIMRIIMKWCVQLMWNFDVVKNILNKQQQFRMKDGSEKILKRKHLIFLSQLLKRERKKVDQYLKKVNINNSECKLDFAQSSWPKYLEKFDKDQVQIGMFASNQIRNYQAYLVGYVNTIIHAIMTATKDFQQMVKAYEYKQKQYRSFVQNWTQNITQQGLQELVNKAYSYRLSNVQASYISLIPQLISFRVGDIMRCKCISKQREIVALYTELQKMSKVGNPLLKIVKVRNRLQSGTKDILINLLYNGKMVVEMQLAIAGVGTKFIDYSIKFNHMLYELRRAQFGPISQLCNIWVSNDLKADFYLEKADLINTRKIKDEKNQDLHICKGDSISMPFRCSECSYFYTDCEYVRKHIQCQDKGCRKFVCSLCQAQKFDYNRLISEYDEIPSMKVLNMKPEQKYCDYRKIIQPKEQYHKVFNNSDDCGLIIDLKGQDKDPKWCKVVRIGKRHIILYLKDLLKEQNLDVLKQLRSQDDIEIFKKQYLMFESKQIIQKIKPKIQKSLQNKCLNKYNFPQYTKKWAQRQKTSIIYMSRELEDQDIEKECIKLKFATKLCLYDNKIKTFQKVMIKFPNVEIVDISKNFLEILQIKDTNLNWSKIKLLYLNYNKITQINQNFAQKFKTLQQLELAHNELAQLPKNFGLISKLKSLNLSINKFTEFPQQITQLSELQILSIYCNKQSMFKIVEIPQSFGNLKRLKKLNINFNGINKLPDSFGDLGNLQILFAVDNNLKSLPMSFSKLSSLKVLNLASNNFIKFPQSICSLTKLQVLHLERPSSQKKKDIILPDSFGDLENLQMLDISGISIVHIPEYFGKLKNLQTLFIYENKIKKLPDSMGNLKKLRHLYASNNYLSCLPDSICQLQNLTKLTLQQMKDLKQLPEQFGNLSSLKILLCRGSGLEKLPDKFKDLTQLAQLDIKDTKIRQLSPQLKDMKNLRKLNIDVQNLIDSSSRQIVKHILGLDGQILSNP